VVYSLRVNRLRRESSTLSSIRPEPFGSERLDMSLRPELRPRGSSTCLMAEGRPNGAVEGKGKASPLEAGRTRSKSLFNNRKGIEQQLVRL